MYTYVCMSRERTGRMSLKLSGVELERESLTLLYTPGYELTCYNYDILLL